MKPEERITKLEKTVAARRGAHAASEQKTSWGEHHEYNAYHRSFKALRRLKKLLQLAPDLRCPDCGEIKTRPGQWVIVPGKDLAACLACYREHYTSSTGRKRIRTPDDPYQIAGPLVIRELTYYVVSGAKVKEARKRADLSGREFLRLVGWTQHFQSSIEQGSVVLNASQLNKIIETLEKFGVTFV